MKIENANAETSSGLYLYVVTYPAEEYEVEVYIETEYCITTVFVYGYVSYVGKGDVNCESTDSIITTGI